MSELHKFIFDGMPVRGMLVRLDDSWREVLQRRALANDAFAQPVRVLMGEMAAAATLMQASIKFEGALVLQIFGDGPVKLAVAEVQSDLAFRVTAKVVGEVGEQARLEALVNVHGVGRCAITLDPKDRFPGQQPYQGVVSLHGDQREPLQHISEVLEHYMLQSEQLDTVLVLAADDKVAAGLLIQRLPIEGEGNLAGKTDSLMRESVLGQSEDFSRISILTKSIKREELLGLDAETILHRLYWEEPLARFEPFMGDNGPRFACRCNRERVGNMIRSLGTEEVEGIIAEQGQVEVGCDFCGAQYRFDPVDAAGLFTGLPPDLPAGSVH